MQKITIRITGLLILCLFTQRVFSQQLKLGKNPYAVEKSAVLELQSDNQGLLFPRISDTALINLLNPPAGMVIYHQPSQQLMLRAANKWTSLSGGSSSSAIDTSSITNFYLKVRSLFSAGNGINYNATTGVITSTVSGGGGSSGNGWSLSGNSGVSYNFLGTTDGSPLVLKVNNNQVGRFDANNFSLGASASVGGGSNSLAIGPGAYTTSNNAIGIGNGAQVQGGTESIAIGKGTYVSSSNAIAMGNTAMAQAVAAIVLGQGAYASGTNSIVIGANNAKAQNTSAISIGPAAYTSGSSSIAIGDNSQSQGANAIVMGKNAYASGSNSISIGGAPSASTKAQGNGSISIGTAAITYNTNGIALGASALANSQNSMAIGFETYAGGSYSMALGDGASAGGANSLALGKDANTASYTNSTAIGVNATVAQNDAIVLGDINNNSLEVGIGTNMPQAKLDVQGTVKLGASGSVIKNVIGFSYTFYSSTSSFKTSNGSTGDYDVMVNIPNKISSTSGTVSVSFNQDLPDGVSVAFARISSTSQVKVRFMNHNNGSASLPSGLIMYLSLTEF